MTRIPPVLLVLQDAAFFLVVALAHGAGVLAGREAALVAWPWSLPLFAPVYPLVTLLFVVLLDRLVPAVPEGRHPLGSRAFLLWGIHLVLYRALRIPPCNWLIRYSNVLRWIWLRGLGADAAFTAQLSGDVNVLDHRPLTLGAGCVIGSECIITTHMIVHGELVAERVTVGERALVGARSTLGPGSAIGADARIEFSVAVGPRVHVGARAKVGALTSLAPGAQVGEGATVEMRSHLPQGMRVPAGERWGGNPARKLDQVREEAASS